ncbi:MAG: pyridoxal 5'-phosphate synthase glutaminase subunit PdxT [Nocardioidaceae bacterium]
MTASTRPTIGVFALQGDVREHLRMLRDAGVDAVPVRRPDELSAVDAMVIPGGESTTMYKLANVFELFVPLRERIQAGMPTLGTCAGMIMLADRIEGGIEGQQTLGGLDVVVRRNAFGRQVDSFEADVDFAPFDMPLHAVFIRAPWVDKAGDGVEVLATVSTGPAIGRIVAVRQDNVLATSFHPEIARDHRVHRYFVDLVRSS